MGGTLQSPDYRSVCTGQTGHAEVVEVEYDPTQIDFSTLMSRFFEWHDPTQVNRQGPDVGTQYRTAIFPQTDTQRVEAQQMINQLNQSGDYSQPIATTIESADLFWIAEDYHQHYLDKRGSATAESKIGSRSRHWRLGGIGQAVAEHLIKQGHEVICTSRSVRSGQGSSEWFTLTSVSPKVCTRFVRALFGTNPSTLFLTTRVWPHCTNRISVRRAIRQQFEANYLEPW